MFHSNYLSLPSYLSTCLFLSLFYVRFRILNCDEFHYMAVYLRTASTVLRLTIMLETLHPNHAQHTHQCDSIVEQDTYQSVWLIDVSLLLYGMLRSERTINSVRCSEEWALPVNLAMCSQHLWCQVRGRQSIIVLTLHLFFTVSTSLTLTTTSSLHLSLSHPSLPLPTSPEGLIMAVVTMPLETAKNRMAFQKPDVATGKGEANRSWRG